jgi:transposase
MFLRGISMKKLVEILRLHYDGKLSSRKIEKSVRISRTTIRNYLKLFNDSGLPWPLPLEYQNEDKLSNRLDPNRSPAVLAKRAPIDFIEISKELRKHKHLTLQLLWEERKQLSLMDHSYSNFALLYRKWLGTQPNYMRQVHKSGEKVFVDYSGDKVNIIDTDTGLMREAEIFVGVLGASKYLYVEATWSQKISDWTMSHVRMFEHLGGSVNLVITDNLRSAVAKSDRYDPDITPAYYHMLAHYGTAAMPARVYRPKDKPDAEGGVLIIQRWILAVLRHEQIRGLSALNIRLAELMAIANKKKFKLYPENRLELFNELDKPYLRPLPAQNYVHREYIKARVGGDYHVILDKHHYSVPYKLIGLEVDVWHTSGIVECYYKNECVAKHIKSTDVRGQTTCSLHMPKAHKEYASLTVDKMQQWAKRIGISTSAIVDLIIDDAVHKEIACRRSNGFLNLSKKYSEIDLENACIYALNNGIRNYEYIEGIINHQSLLVKKSESSAIPLHENIRGADQYH